MEVTGVDVTELDRHELMTRAIAAFGEKPADTLMSLLPMAGWNDVVRESHLRAAVAEINARFDGRQADTDVKFADMNARFAEVDARFAEVDARFAEVHARFDRMKADTDVKFTAVDARFDQMQADMDVKFTAVDARFDRMQADMDVKFADLRRLITDANSATRNWLLTAMVGVVTIATAFTSLTR